MNREKQRQYWLFIIVALIFLGLGLITYRSVFLPGHIILGDFTKIKSAHDFLYDQILSTWNNKESHNNINQLSKIAIYLPLLLFGRAVSYTTIALLYLIGLSIISGLSMFSLSRSCLGLKEIEPITKEIFPLCTALIYTLSPFITTEASHPTIKFAYYLTPLMVLLLLRGLIQNRKRYTLICALVWSMAISAMHWIVFGAIIVILTVLIWLIHSVIAKNLQFTKAAERAAKHFLFVLSMFLALNLYWIIPGLLSGGTALYGNILTKEGVCFIFRNANPLNILALRGGFEDQRYWEQGIQTTISTAAGLILTVTALSSLLWKTTSLKKLFLACLTLFAVFLGAGPKLAPPVYYWFQFQAPGHSIWSWALRTPKTNFLVPFSVSLLLATTSIAIEQAVARHIPRAVEIFRVTFLIFVLILISIGNYPLITGTFNGNLWPTKLPPEFNEAINWVRNQTYDHKVLWGPPYGGWSANWHSTSIGGLTEGITPRSTFSTPTFNDILTWPLLFGRSPSFKSLVYYNEVNDLSKFLSPLSIGAMLIHDDIIKYGNQIAIIVQNLERTNLKPAWHANYISAFKIENSAPLISNRSSLISISGGLRVYNSLTYLDSFQPYDQQAVVYADQKFNTYQLTKTNVFVTNHDVTDFILQAVRDKLVLAPFEYTNRYSPANAWSKAAMTGLSFRGQLSRRGILDQYQFGFSKGVVFTWGSVSLSDEVNPAAKDLVADWEFDTDASLASWKEIKGNWEPGIQELKWKDGHLVNKLLVSTWGWKGIKTVPIVATYGSMYRIAIRLKARDIYKLHIKVEELNASQDIVRAEQIVGLGSGSFGWKRVLAEYSPISPECRYLRLVIWHGQETETLLPNTLYVDYIRVYDVTQYSKPISLGVPFTVKEDNKYDVFIRYLESKRGGSIRLYVDGESILVNTKGPADRFMWRNLGVFNFAVGEHRINIENVEGFNAVNVLVVLPSNEYLRAEDNFKTMLNNSAHIVYALEAEADLHPMGKEDRVSLRPGASNGRVIELNKGEGVWQALKIIKGGMYKLAIAGQGTLKIAIDEYNEILTAKSGTLVYLGPMTLEAGSHQLKITALSDGAFLDIIWLYSVSNSEPLEELFAINAAPAPALDYTKVSPTEYTVKVNASTPFMLALSESYDPLWIAEARTPGGLNQYSSEPLYGVINGFWIDEMGECTITIRYKPQRWFHYGAIISALSLLGAMGYLVWDWRKRRARSKK